MGHMEGRVLDEMLREGSPLPERIQNAPELLDGLELFYNAFQDLSSCRSFGMSIGPIPWTAIDRFCRRHNITGQQFEDMVHHIYAMDEVFRAHVDKKGKRGGSKS